MDRWRKARISDKTAAISAAPEKGDADYDFPQRVLQMRATIQAVDNDSWQKMIYQHAISTVGPNRPVNLNGGFLPRNN